MTPEFLLAVSGGTALHPSGLLEWHPQQEPASQNCVHECGQTGGSKA